jgi:hypothetical protein
LPFKSIELRANTADCKKFSQTSKMKENISFMHQIHGISFKAKYDEKKFSLRAGKVSKRRRKVHYQNKKKEKLSVARRYFLYVWSVKVKFLLA